MKFRFAKPALFICSFFIFLFTSGQEKSPCKFGKIAAADFQNKVYSIDSSADAVVIADIGTSEIEGNNKNSVSLIYKRYSRIHILNKNGYDAADFKISLYQSGNNEETLENLKAVTYNLENGAVTETKLEKSNVFKDKVDQNWFVKKFTLPNIKEGSIIEIQYEIKSDFIFNFQSWNFQGSNPVLWSEYNASIPQCLGYVFLSQGYQTFDIRDDKIRNSKLRISDARSSSATTTDEGSMQFNDYRWVMKNVPALKAEGFTSTLKNHIARLDFQLSETRPPFQYQNIMGTWPDLAKKLLESEDFGRQIARDNNWLGDIVKPILAGAKNNEDRANKIYSYIRDNFTCTDHGRLYTEQGLKAIAKSKNGNESEINLLLTAMLRYADIKADPVILSTRSNGYTNAIYPLLSRFNYVITRAVIDNKEYYFDASVPRLAYGKLMSYCYNGHARIVDNNMTAIEFNPDSICEKKISSIFLINDEKGNIKGTMQQSLGYYESLSLREQIKEKGQESIVKDIQKGYQGYGEDAQVKEAVFDSLTKLDNPITLKYDVLIKNSNDDILYVSPMFGENYKNNPFKSATRFYPVEMPYTSDELLIVNMEVPKGYVVDELPKPMRMKLMMQETVILNTSVRNRMR